MSTTLNGLAAEKDLVRKNELAREWGRRLTDAETTSLLAAMPQGSEDERDAAIRVLKWKRDWREPEKSLWTAALQREVRDHYPTRRIGQVAFSALFAVDREAAERLILAIDPASLSDPETERLIVDCTAFGRGSRPFARLAEVERAGGPVGEQARLRRELAGEISQERVEELRRAWRREGTPAAMGTLYHLYLSRLPVGTPFTEIVALLGEPHRRSRGRCFYSPSQGTSLYIELDDRDRLVRMAWTS